MSWGALGPGMCRQQLGVMARGHEREPLLLPSGTFRVPRTERHYELDSRLRARWFRRIFVRCLSVVAFVRDWHDDSEAIGFTGAGARLADSG